MAIDIWSLGCILGELMAVSEPNVETYGKKKDILRYRYMFTGDSCFPISPVGRRKKGQEE